MLSSFIKEQQKFNGTISDKIDGLSGGLETVKDSLETVQGDLTKVQDDLGGMKGDLTKVQDDLGGVKDGLTKVQDDLKTVQNDLGVVKGAHARNEVLRETSLIATDMHYRFVKNLSRAQIGTIAAKAVEFDPDDLKSFRHADVVMEADKLDGGGRHYIAVEVSYTVNEGDVRRAIRNAKYLRDLTKKEAHAAVAGVDIVPAAKKRVDCGDVHWYEIPARDVQPA